MADILLFENLGHGKLEDDLGYSEHLECLGCLGYLGHLKGLKD